jgi:hypothetical protein
MSELDDTLASTRSAVDEMIRTASTCSATWSTPRSEGKWSPSRVVEHVALALEASADEIAGRPSRFPNLPRPIRPIVRTLLFNRVLKSGKFPKGKTNARMNPAAGPATPAAGIERLDAAWRALTTACADTSRRSDEMTSAIFGRVRVVDFLRFQEHHTRHHQRQMTW